MARRLGPLPSIVCPQCSMTSYNPRDIAERWCGYCHAFHRDMSGRSIGGGRLWDRRSSRRSSPSTNKAPAAAAPPSPMFECPNCGGDIAGTGHRPGCTRAAEANEGLALGQRDAAACGSQQLTSEPLNAKEEPSEG